MIQPICAESAVKHQLTNYHTIVSAIYNEAVHFNSLDQLSIRDTVIMNVIFMQSRSSVLWHCWLGNRKGIWSVKSWVLVCRWWWFDWSFARLIAPLVTTHHLHHMYTWQLLYAHRSGSYCLNYCESVLSLYICGQSSWKPWLVACGIDISRYVWKRLEYVLLVLMQSHTCPVSKYYWRPSLSIGLAMLCFYSKTGFWPLYCQISIWSG